MPDDSDLTPTEPAPLQPERAESPPVSANVTINQFIQLVNQQNNFPAAQDLVGYTAQDKEWIKNRVDIEQDHRHRILGQLVENEHKAGLRRDEQAHQRENLITLGAFTVVIVTISISAYLIHIGAGYWALGLIAIVIGGPVATGLSKIIIDQVRERVGKEPPKEGT
jgi:hypothetical protein